MATIPNAAGGPVAAPKRRPWRAALAIFFGCLVVYHANGRNHSGVDTFAAPYTAWSLVRHGSLDLHAYTQLQKYWGNQIRILADGRCVSERPPGSALAAVPVVAPFAAFREPPLKLTDMNHLGKLAAAGCVAAAAVVFFFLCRRLAPDAAWPATAVFALGTCLWSVASQALWMHGPAVFWLCCGLYGLIDMEEKRDLWRPAAVGFALGMALMCRPTTAFFGVAAGVALLGGRRWGGLAGLALGALLPVGAYVVINWQMFGNPLLGGYYRDDWATATPLWLGVSGLIAAPSRGVLVYTPALLLMPVGVYTLLRSGPMQAGVWRRWVLLSWLAAAAATLVFYARWHDWYGGWCYGPRVLCETMPICCLLFACGYAALPRVWERRAALTLVAMSVFVHFVGVFGDKAADGWFGRHELHDQGRCLFSLRDMQIEAFAGGVVDTVASRFFP